MHLFTQMLQSDMAQVGHEVRVLQPPPLIGRLLPKDIGLGKWLGYLDRYVLFRLLLRRAATWADVVHICDQANAPYARWLAGKPHIVTCHDMIAIRSAIGEIRENQTRWTGRIYQRWILGGLRCARNVVCVSEQTRNEFIRIAGISGDRVSVVHNALNYPYRHMDSREAEGYLIRLGLVDRRPYLLHVGGNQWYKNREGVQRIFKRLLGLAGCEQYNLVMAGMSWTEEMRIFVREAKIEDRVHEIIKPSNELLQAIYSQSDGLLFPSLAEGFGWPIVEAQASGCPVFTSGFDPMTEVGGKGAIYFDPADEDEAAKIIAAGLRKTMQMRLLGFENAKRYTKEAMISGYVNAYHSAMVNEHPTHKQRVG